MTTRTKHTTVKANRQGTKRPKTSRHDLAELFVLFVANQQSEQTGRSAGYRLRQFASWLQDAYGIEDLEAVETSHLLSYKQHLAGSGLAASTQARMIEGLRSFFRWCFQMGMIERDPAALLKAPRAVLNREPTYLETSEVKALFAAIDPADRQAARDTALLWCLSYGLRAGEIVGLDIADVIPPKGDGMAALEIDGKRSYHRTLPICGAAYNAIQAHVTQRGNVVHDALFAVQWQGQPKRLSIAGLEKWFRVLCDRAGIPQEKQHPHACRHGAAVRWLFESTTPGALFTVSKALGHSSVSTTQRYLHARREAVEQMVLTDPLAS